MQKPISFPLYYHIMTRVLWTNRNALRALKNANFIGGRLRDRERLAIIIARTLDVKEIKTYIPLEKKPASPILAFLSSVCTQTNACTDLKILFPKSFAPIAQSVHIFTLFPPLSNLSQIWNYHAWFHASSAKQNSTALFWVITQRVVVISYRRFGTTYRSHI